MAILLEIAANSIASCMAAQKGGADRVELFENLGEGGCTPSYGMLQIVRKKISIPVYVMIRPRGGDFLYNSDEFEIMKQDIVFCKDLNFQGVVFGMLNANGDVDRDRCKELLSLCGSMKATFHRAFDRSGNLNDSAKKIIDLGFERILTSGGAKDVDSGKEVIKELQLEFGKHIIIMPGCGVAAKNARYVADYCGVKEMHATAKEKITSQMQYKKLHFTDDWFESDLRQIIALKEQLS